jgi:hypothetical protein
MFNQKSVKWSFLITSILVLAACGEVGPSPSLSSSSASTSLTSSESSTEIPSEQQFQIYLKAQQSGYTGTYEEWLASIKGADGTALLSGTTNPTSSEGKNGDTFVNTVTWDVFVKSSGNWTNVGNIMGPKGDKGDQGEPGQNGTDGLSSYEIYKRYYPGYPGTEQDWINDYVNAQLVKTVTINFDGGTTSSYKTTYFKGEKLETLPSTTKQYYTLEGWQTSNELINPSYLVIEDIIISAIWTLIPGLNINFTITWKNHDDSILEIDINVPVGTLPNFDGETPIRQSTGEYTYSFSGWTPFISVVTQASTYTAQFTETLIISPEAIYFDYLCNYETDWEQCDEANGTVKNLSVFGQERTYFRRYGVIQYVHTSGTKYIIDLKKSTIRYEYNTFYYQRDLLFKTWSGNVNRTNANILETNFTNRMTIIESHFAKIDEIFGENIELSDFNPNWSSLLLLENNLYFSPDELMAIEMAKDIEKIITSINSYGYDTSTSTKGSFTVTNKTGKTIDFFEYHVLFYNEDYEVINSKYSNHGFDMLNNASLSINFTGPVSYFNVYDVGILITYVSFK